MSLISRETPLEIRARLVTVRTWLAPHIAQGRQWLIAPHSPLTWTALYAWGARLLHTYAGLLTVLVGIVLLLLLLLLLVLPWYAEQRDDKGAVTYPHASLINPILAGLGALFLIYAAIRQARTATEVARAGNRQAEIAGRRHVTDTFGKAVEQLGSDKMEVRIGGIYTLERLAREASPQGTDVTAEEASDLYWAVTENLTAFVRERTQRTEAERSAKPLDQRIAERAYLLWEKAGRPEGRSEEFWQAAVSEEKLGDPPATDIAAVLTALKRRSRAHRAPEVGLDLRQVILRCAELTEVHLEGAWLFGAHLEGAHLEGSHLERADLREASLAGADLGGAHLERVDLRKANLAGANLGGANLIDASLREANLAGADLGGAHLERANLNGAQLEGARLFGGRLEGANLFEANLAGADLGGAHLEGVNLRGNLKGANLFEAHLERADLRWAQLQGANCSRAHLEAASLRGAHLECADLRRAHLEAASFAGACLQNADLRESEGLTQEQIDEAFGDATTKLPDGVSHPAHWPAREGESAVLVV